MSSVPVQTLREMGKDDSIINEAIDRWKANRRRTGKNQTRSLSTSKCYSLGWGRRGHDRMVVGFTTTYAITDVVSSNLDQGEVYNIM